MVHLDAIDKRILNRVQSNFPITRQPYQTIADDVGLTEQEVIQRLARLKKVGIIRRIGANFVPHKVGHVSTLCAAKVPEEKIAQFAEKVNRYRGVTHNYQRDGEYNIWFTFIAPSMADIDANLRQITVETGISDIINLPATQVFKIKAQFDL
jgi:DNA-binding Lrp family transcriptional regulator